MTNILIIEDDPELGSLIRDFLMKAGFTVCLNANAESGLESLENESFGLVLLDVMLPGMNGFETCSAIRSTRDIPILMMSALTDENSKLTGYDTGADDYIDKPFSISVLTAKVRALLRRSAEPSAEQDTDTIESRGIVLDRSSRKVTKNGKEIPMNVKEFELLRCLMEREGEAVRKDTLFDMVWGADCFTEPSTVSVHIRWLREKIEDAPNSPTLIQTVWKVGYRFGDGK